MFKVSSDSGLLPGQTSFIVSASNSSAINRARNDDRSLFVQHGSPTDPVSYHGEYSSGCERTLLPERGRNCAKFLQKYRKRSSTRNTVKADLPVRVTAGWSVVGFRRRAGVVTAENERGHDNGIAPEMPSTEKKRIPLIGDGSGNVTQTAYSGIFALSAATTASVCWRSSSVAMFGATQIAWLLKINRVRYRRRSMASTTDNTQPETFSGDQPGAISQLTGRRVAANCWR